MLTSATINNVIRILRAGVIVRVQRNESDGNVNGRVSCRESAGRVKESAGLMHFVLTVTDERLNSTSCLCVDVSESPNYSASFKVAEGGTPPVAL